MSGLSRACRNCVHTSTGIFGSQSSGSLSSRSDQHQTARPSITGAFCVALLRGHVLGIGFLDREIAIVRVVLEATDVCEACADSEVSAVVVMSSPGRRSLRTGRVGYLMRRALHNRGRGGAPRELRGPGVCCEREPSGGPEHRHTHISQIHSDFDQGSHRYLTDITTDVQGLRDGRRPSAGAHRPRRGRVLVPHPHRAPR